MTVAQLIEKLKEFPPDLPVASFDVEYGVEVVEDVERVCKAESCLMNRKGNREEYVELR